MDGMMGGAGTGAWMLLWVLVGITVAVTGGVVAALALVARHARGDISREEYLQGKVELED